MDKRICKGIVRNGTVVLEGTPPMPDGMEVLVMPLLAPPGSPQAVLAAMRAEPHLQKEDVDELDRAIQDGKRPVSYRNPLAKHRPRKHK